MLDSNKHYEDNAESVRIELSGRLTQKGSVWVETSILGRRMPYKVLKEGQRDKGADYLKQKTWWHLRGTERVRWPKVKEEDCAQIMQVQFLIATGNCRRILSRNDITLHNIPLCICTMSSLSIPLLMDASLRWQRICLQCGRPGFDPWVGKIPWRRAWQPSSVSLPGESPRTEESGGGQSMALQRVRHSWATKHSCWWTFRCFQVLVIVNSALMNIGVHVSFWLMVFSGYMSRSGIAVSYLVLCLVFKDPLYYSP